LGPFVCVTRPFIPGGKKEGAWGGGGRIIFGRKEPLDQFVNGGGLGITNWRTRERPKPPFRAIVWPLVSGDAGVGKRKGGMEVGKPCSRGRGGTDSKMGGISGKGRGVNLHESPGESLQDGKGARGGHRWNKERQ